MVTQSENHSPPCSYRLVFFLFVFLNRGGRNGFPRLSALAHIQNNNFPNLENANWLARTRGKRVEGRDHEFIAEFWSGGGEGKVREASK